MNIAAAVILYFPDDKTVSNITSYNAAVNKVYILDNTDRPHQHGQGDFSNLDNCDYFRDGINMGIAARLNQACKMAKDAGYDWLLTMDQDSHFDQNTLQTYFSCINSFEHAASTGMFGVNYLEADASTSVCQNKQVHQLITSGSVVNLNLIHKTGGFDENLFIDEVDLEYCYKCIRLGLKVVEFPNIYLHHSLGNTSNHISFKSLKVTPRVLHSPIRIYYMCRNYFYINAKYRDIFSNEISMRRKVLLNRIKNNLIYGSNKLALLRYIYRAIADFKKGRVGKYIA